LRAPSTLNAADPAAAAPDVDGTPEADGGPDVPDVLDVADEAAVDREVAMIALRTARPIRPSERCDSRPPARSMT